LSAANASATNLSAQNLVVSHNADLNGLHNYIGTTQDGSDNRIGNSYSGTTVLMNAGASQISMTNAGISATNGGAGLNINQAVASTTTLSGGTGVANSTVTLNSTTATMRTATVGGGSLVVTNVTSSVLTGGSVAGGTNLTLNDTGATFASNTGALPVQVHGVADGTTSFDAVNYQQLKALEKKLSQGVASTTAIANIPQVDQDKTFAVGMGVANYNGQTAIAVGMTYRPMPNAVLKVSASAGSGSTVFGGGAAMSF
jgi:hypothetical protein